MRIHPGGFRLVLAGPKVARLLPFLQEKGFVAEAFVKGGEALNRMRQAPCHLLLHELECGDMMGIDLARGAKQEGIAAAALLVDDPMKSGMIIAALARGVDSYVSIPPDETIFFDRIENMLLAQWGLVVTQQQQTLQDEVARLTAQLKDVENKDAQAKKRDDSRIAELSSKLAAEQKRVKDLLRETDVLREQLATMHLVTGAKSGLSDEGNADHEEVDFLIDDDPTIKPIAKAKAPPTLDDDDFAEMATQAVPAPAAPAAKPGELDDFVVPASRSFGKSDDVATQAIPAALATALVSEARAGDSFDAEDVVTVQVDRRAKEKVSIFEEEELDFDSEKTPAGLMAATPPPKASAFIGNDEQTAPGGIDASQFSKPLPKNKPASVKTSAKTTIDSQIVRDLAALKQDDNDDVLFDDD